MATDPRKFLTDCAPARSTGQNTQQKDFFSALGKVGDLEVLNDSNSEIRQGLSTLASISENVRNGDGRVPSAIRDLGSAILDPINNAGGAALERAQDFVLDTVGVGSRETRDTFSLNPDVANRALGQAEAIADAVAQGRYDEFEDIPAAIQDFTNAEILIRGIFTRDTERTDKFKELCVSPYAADLIEHAPKHKFMFVVEFVLNAPYAQDFFNTSAGTPSHDELAFVVKRAARPNISFEYEEVNFYNFRSKILKRHEYQPIAMSFYDDHQSGGLWFMNEYLRQISPLSRNGEPSAQANFEPSGMTFDDPSILTAGTSSLLDNGDGSGSPKTIINHIKLYHVYQGGKLCDVYTFAAPKITEWQLDELDMTQTGDGTELSFTFAYDALNISLREPVEAKASQLTDATDQGFYPIVPNFNGSSRGAVTSGS